MPNFYVYIDPAATAIDDQAGETQTGMKEQGFNKSFTFDGQQYTLNPGEMKSVPEGVALAWNSSDSEVVISYDGFRSV